MSEAKHTKTPWTIVDTSIVSGEVCIAVLEDDGGYEAPALERKANADFIVLACNSYDDLLAACMAAEYAFRQTRDMNKSANELRAAKLCKAALKAAEGRNV
jgi:hypothetical protein